MPTLSQNPQRRRYPRRSSRPGYSAHRATDGQPIPFVAHQFIGWTICALCYGYRDDPRHWCDVPVIWSLRGWLRGKAWSLPDSQAPADVARVST